jgi:hypothetical protein
MVVVDSAGAMVDSVEVVVNSVGPEYAERVLDLGQEVVWDV